MWSEEEYRREGLEPALVRRQVGDQVATLRMGPAVEVAPETVLWLCVTYPAGAGRVRVTPYAATGNKRRRTWVAGTAQAGERVRVSVEATTASTESGGGLWLIHAEAGPDGSIRIEWLDRDGRISRAAEL